MFLVTFVLKINNWVIKMGWEIGRKIGLRQPHKMIKYQVLFKYLKLGDRNVHTIISFTYHISNINETCNTKTYFGLIWSHLSSCATSLLMSVFFIKSQLQRDKHFSWKRGSLLRKKLMLKNKPIIESYDTPIVRH